MYTCMYMFIRARAFTGIDESPTVLCIFLSFSLYLSLDPFLDLSVYLSIYLSISFSISVYLAAT